MKCEGLRKNNSIFWCFSVGGDMAVSTTPTIDYKRATLTRYVVVIEDTKDMLIRVSLKLCFQNWKYCNYHTAHIHI